MEFNFDEIISTLSRNQTKSIKNSILTPDQVIIEENIQKQQKREKENEDQHIISQQLQRYHINPNTKQAVVMIDEGCQSSDVQVKDQELQISEFQIIDNQITDDAEKILKKIQIIKKEKCLLD